MFDTKFGTIKGLSDRRRLPLLGKIRLGIKKQSSKGTTYPAETDYFVCPPEVQKVYGEKPKSINIMLPVAQRHIIFPQAYRWYGTGRGLKCIGNGECANRFSDDKKAMTEIECPCEKLENGECKQRAFLMVMLPEVNMGGVYQVSTGAFNSIVDINSGLDYVEALVGRVQMVPLKLLREPIETHNDGKKQTHYTLRLRFDGDVNFLNQLRENTKRIMLESEKIALPPPQDENPEADPVDEVDGVVDEETVATGPISDAQIEILRSLYKQKSFTNDTWAQMLISKYAKTDVSLLTKKEADELIQFVGK
jgi:hypothetical protein